MAYFELYNADGSLNFSSDNRLLRVLGQVQVGIDAGAVTHPGFVTGDPWYAMVPMYDNQDVYTAAKYPDIAINYGSPKSISWSARPQSGEFVFYPMMMVYGVY